MTVTVGLMAVAVVAPNPPERAEADSEVPTPAGPQSLVVAGSAIEVVERDSYKASKAPTLRVAPASGTPDPGSAQAIAYEMVTARGWGQGEFDCLVALWNRESGWNVYAHNKSSGAYGIPQSLPGSKMASAGEDWATNPATQITWGLSYIQGRYASPCGAWNASQIKGWY